MTRSLELLLEPADAFSAMLRLKAALEAGRCPPELSMPFRAATEAEFAHLEPAVRTLGVCLAQLEECGIAALDRSALSRFADINNALHLVALPAAVTVDIDAVRMALDRGDPSTQAQAATVATAVRALLWYAAHTDLLVCTQVVLASAEVPPDRALRFVDAHWAGAWSPGHPPLPPDPRRARTPSVHPPLDPRASVTPAAPLPLVKPIAPSGPGESTAVMRSPLPERVAEPDAAAAMEYLGREHTAPSVGVEQLLDTLPTGRRAALAQEVSSGATMQMQATDILGDDARLFLTASGAPWPCDLDTLEQAHRALGGPGRAGAGLPASERAVLRPRLERGYAELRQLLRPSGG